MAAARFQGGQRRAHSTLLTFGLGKRDAASRLVIEWPSGATQEFNNVRVGSYECTEGQGLTAA